MFAFRIPTPHFRFISTCLLLPALQDPHKLFGSRAGEYGERETKSFPVPTKNLPPCTALHYCGILNQSRVMLFRGSVFGAVKMHTGLYFYKHFPSATLTVSYINNSGPSHFTDGSHEDCSACLCFI
jgi:hypothetical protein